MNIESTLNRFGISYKSNDSAKVTNINCPWCVGQTRGLSDYRFLCGIFNPKGNFHCLRCGRTGSFKYLLKEVAGITDEEYNELFDVQIDDDESVSDIIKSKFQYKKPKFNKKELSDIPGQLITQEIVNESTLLSRFMKDRNLSIDTLITNECRLCGYVGNYANRLILPIFYNNKIVSFQARDLTGKSSKKYDNPVVSISDYLYETRFDDKSHVYIVEGIFDAWRMVHNTVAVFGKSLTKTQKRLLRDLDVEKYIFCLDSDAYYAIIKEMKELADYVDKVGMIMLPKGKDPDNLGREKIEQLPVRWI